MTPAPSPPAPQTGMGGKIYRALTNNDTYEEPSKRVRGRSKLIDTCATWCSGSTVLVHVTRTTHVIQIHRTTVQETVTRLPESAGKTNRNSHRLHHHHHRLSRRACGLPTSR